ncbi:hypothetical protein [Scytonema sp. PCC 10023]|uniref:hypothetical protein n=1 Tax=Scytonema sp. PCC 10023 TaxID=1680591 RepID=UPI0039C70763
MATTKEVLASVARLPPAKEETSAPLRKALRVCSRLLSGNPPAALSHRSVSTDFSLQFTAKTTYLERTQ